MFKIGEFSKITQVSIRMLRYYDEQKLLIPCFIDTANGYRMYSAEQIEELGRIVLLRDMGFGVKEIKELLKSWNLEEIKSNILEQMKKTEYAIQAEKNKLQQMQGYLYDLDHQEKKLNIQIIMKQLPTQNVISLRRVMPDYFSESLLWNELGTYLNEINNVDTFPSFSIYHDLDYREENVDIEICVVIDNLKNTIDSDQVIYRQVDQVDIAACFMIYGPYKNISLAYKEFAYWLEQHSEYCMAGENRQICHVCMCHTTNSEDYITELQIPLKYVTD